jgi:hypothetical protein
MSEHAKFSVDTGVQVYLCDPSSQWQRGSNENTGCCGSTSPKASRWPATAKPTSTKSPRGSTGDLDKP